MSARLYKRYVTYKDSGVDWMGDVPSHWDVAKMWRVGIARSGGTPSKEEPAYWNGEIPWVSPKDMKRPVIDSSEDTVTERAVRETALRIFQPPVVLIVVRGMILAHSFPVAMTTVPVTINQDMKALTFIDGILPEFVVRLFEGVGKSILATIIEEAGHGTKVVRMDVWRTVPLAIPPQVEQRAIVTFLEREAARIDALVAKKERLIALLQERRTALITRAVTKGLNSDAPMKDSGVEWLEEIPAHWEVRRLKLAVRKIGSGKTPSGGAEVYVKSGAMLLRSQNVHYGELRLDDVAYIDERTDSEMSGSRVSEGDVLLNITGASLGRCCVAHLGGHVANVNQHVCIVRPNKQLLRSGFLGAAMASRAVQAQIFSTEDGISRDALSFEQIGELLIATPPMAEQENIEAKLAEGTKSIEALLRSIRVAIANLHELRTALTSAAVTGKIDVREAVQ